MSMEQHASNPRAVRERRSRHAKIERAERQAARRRRKEPVMKVVCRQVPYEVVAPWRSRAARDGVALGPTGRTTWFAAYRGEELVGVAGVIRMGRVARLKGMYVPEPLRGQGIGTALTEARIASIPDDLDIEVLAYHPSFWKGRGFEPLGDYRPGVTRLIYARAR